MSDVAVEPKLEGSARTYLLDRITDCLLQADEPLKVSEILAAVQQDGTVTSRLLRAVLESSDNYQAIDRRWLMAAPEVDPRRPIEASVEQVLQQIGRPMTAEQIARLLAEGVGRPVDVLLPSVQQVVRGRGKYFAAGDRWGLTAWLLDVDDHDEEEIIFRNFFLDEEVLTRFRETLGGLPWDRQALADSAVKVLRQAGEPVPGKVLQFLAWCAARRAFRPGEFFAQLLDHEDALLLSTGHWCAAEMVGEFGQTLETFAEQLAEREAPETTEEGATPRVFEVTASEVAEIAGLLADRRSHRISEVIETIFELSPGERDYNAAFGSVWGAMGADERFAWVGGERWRLAGTVPRLLNKVPELLDLPYLPYFVNEDGEPLDVELAEEGFEGDLLEWVKDPRVMIAGQPIPEGSVPEEAPPKVTPAIRYELRLAGALPIYGDLRAFFPTQPEVVEITLLHAGKSFTAWLNNNLNLMVELGPFFDRLDLPLCGGSFQLQPRGKGVTTDYTVSYKPGDVDPLVAVSDERLAVLEAMREDPENTQTSTFELIQKILGAYDKKGLHFVTLFTEVNVVRRTHAYLIASILSAYACFNYLRPGYWGYDEKKVEQGIRRQKRKYIKE